MRRTTRNLQAKQKRQAEQSVRVAYGDMTSTTPAMASFDNGDTEQDVVVLNPFTPVIGDRIVALKQGNAPALVIGSIG